MNFDLFFFCVGHVPDIGTLPMGDILLSAHFSPGLTKFLISKIAIITLALLKKAGPFV